MRPFTAALPPTPRPPQPIVQPDLAASSLDTLDDHALLSLMLERVVKGSDAQAVATGLLDRFDGLGDVLAADVSELGRVSGVCPALILDLKLLRQLSIRLARTAACRRPVMTSFEALRAYAISALAHLPREQFRALYLDRRNNLMVSEEIANGTADHAPVYPREVIRRALEVSASALILVHNHPSGDPAPSQADIAMTRQIVDAAKVFGLQVHDHLIVGRAGTASLRALGLM